MTGRGFVDRLNSLASPRPEDALRPPDLTIVNIGSDLVRHVRVYRDNRLGTFTLMAFLALRVIQHVAYHRGWRAGLR